jgi:hypothetical protein
MSQFEIRVTQELKGFYDGRIIIDDVDTKEEAIEVLKSMSNKEIDELADWTHGDEYYGDANTIEIDESVVEEL